MDEKEQELQEMDFWSHLADLRAVFVRSALIVLVLFCACFAFSSELITYLSAPLMQAMPDVENVLHFTGPLDVFIASMKVSLLSAIILGAPFWMFQFWSFVSPALYNPEKIYVIPFVITSLIFFYLGVAFCFFIILPMALEFLIGIGLEVGTPIITINDYLSMVMILIFGFGLIFETPLVLILLALMDLVTSQDLAKNRLAIVVGILVCAAILTPPDPISQVAMAVPVYLMFEGSIIVIRMLKK